MPFSNHRRVLVVEDESLTRWSLRECLEQAGYLVCEAGDGAEALACWRDDIDLVILDWKLPQLDGLAVLERMKRKRFACPVIMITAHGTEDLGPRARAFGVRVVLDKPFDLKRLVRLVGEALAGATA